MSFTISDIEAQRHDLAQLQMQLDRLRVRHLEALDAAREIQKDIQLQMEAVSRADARLLLMLNGNESAGFYFRAVCKTPKCMFGHKKRDPLFKTKEEARAHASTHMKPKQPHRLKIESVVRWA